MNERIKELLTHCTDRIVHSSSAFLVDRIDHEKFAELIIKECAIFVESSRLVGVFEREPEKVASYLKEYFGVECEKNLPETNTAR